MRSLVGKSERPVERLLQAAQECGHQGLSACGFTVTSFPSRILGDGARKRPPRSPWGRGGQLTSQFAKPSITLPKALGCLVPERHQHCHALHVVPVLVAKELDQVAF